jgi:methionine-rich copper-binding protein CopC
MVIVRTLLLVAALFAAPRAFAHAFPQHASPAAGAALRTPPPAVTITFTEGVESHFSTIEVTDTAGKRVDASAPHTVGGNQVLAVDLPALVPGTYTVTWHVTSVDTHKTEGRYTFTVLP